MWHLWCWILKCICWESVHWSLLIDFQSLGSEVDAETTPCPLQEMSYASALQPKMKKVRRTIYAIMGRLNLHDVRERLDKQIENGGGVLAWSTLDSPPSGRWLRQRTAAVDVWVKEGWTHATASQH
jgi:hypothetical protein